ncbi:MAG: glycosyltransferase family 4 protein [Ornithinimicrobium sp.]
MRTSDPAGRVLSPGDMPGPSGGSIYNERIAHQWGTTVQYLPGQWPFPQDCDLAHLAQTLARDPRDRLGPVLLDGLIGGAAPAQIRAARAAGVRVVILVHLPLPAESGHSAAQQRDLAAQEGAALHEASAVACTSQWAAHDLQERYGLTRIVVAQPGTDRQPFAVGSRPAQLITPASYTPRKNHRLLIEALASPALAGREWQARWLGTDPTGTSRDDVATAVTTAGLSDRVRVSSACTGTALDRAWSASDLLLLPSLTETYAMVVAEALARGIPAVVGAGTAAEHTLRGPAQGRPLRAGGGADPAGMPGAALATDDPQVWAETITRWLTSPRLRHRWRLAALERREQLPTWDEPADTLATLMGES